MLNNMFGSGIAIEESQDLKVFSDIHRYFKHKYRIEGDSFAFNSRLEHFSKALAAILQNSVFLEPFPSGAKKYKLCYIQLFSGYITAEMIVAYLISLSEEAADAFFLLKKKSFYQLFLIEGLWGRLNDYLTNDQFDKIVDRLPGNLLFLAQCCSVNKKHGSLVDSNLLLQLRKASSSNTIYRYCKMVLRFPKNNPLSSPYFSSVYTLNCIAPDQVRCALGVQNFPVSMVEHSKMRAAIFQALLFSSRSQDASKANLVLYANLNDVSFIIDTLCVESCLKFLGEKQKEILGGFDFICSSIIEAAWKEYCSDRRSSILIAFNRAIYDYTWYNSGTSRVDLAILPSLVCARFLGLLKLQYTKKFFTREMLVDVILRIKKMPESFEKENRLMIMHFIVYFIHNDFREQGGDINLIDYCNRVFSDSNKAGFEQAKCLNVYLMIQLSFYPETHSDLLLYINIIREKFPELGPLINTGNPVVCSSNLDKVTSSHSCHYKRASNDNGMY